MALLVAGACSFGQDYKMALGLRASSKDAIVGSSATFKYFFNEKTAVEALVSVTDPLALGVQVEKQTQLPLRGLNWFYGAGPYLAFGSDHRFGLHGIAGLDYKLSKLPVSLQLDWKPEANIVKEFTFEPAVIGLSVRYTW
jgi:hypothetical protein